MKPWYQGCSLTDIGGILQYTGGESIDRGVIRRVYEMTCRLHARLYLGEDLVYGLLTIGLESSSAVVNRTIDGKEHKRAREAL